ncbi:MAG: P1 family peptidase [Hyphomicrobiaceae bacterium]
MTDSIISHGQPRLNLITDVPGLRVGNAHDAALMSGVTVLIGDAPLVGAIDVRGGGAATRDCDALSLAGTVDQVHAIALSGGSAFGLAAATGVQSVLAERGVGFAVRNARVPIVPSAILFDLTNGGDKAWGASPPYERLGRQAAEAAGHSFAIGSAGAGYGATTATLRGGLGSASQTLPDGTVVGALVAVNPVGSVTIGDTAIFWAAPCAPGGELGGQRWPETLPDDALVPRLKDTAPHPSAGEATTLAVVATSASLTKAQAHRLAVMAQTGLARAIYPVHTPLDGDVAFAVSTCHTAPPATPHALALLGAAAANVLARAVARGVYHAAAPPAGWKGPSCWRQRFTKA